MLLPTGAFVSPDGSPGAQRGPQRSPPNPINTTCALGSCATCTGVIGVYFEWWRPCLAGKLIATKPFGVTPAPTCWPVRLLLGAGRDQRQIAWNTGFIDVDGVAAWCGST